MAQSIKPTGTHLQIATDSNFKALVLDEETEYRTSVSFVKDELPYGQDLFAHVAHTHPKTGKTNWSNPIRFTIKVPANIIGVCLDNSNAATRGTFHWIDALGNQVSYFDWQNHPTYAGIEMVTTDLTRAPVTLTKFPLFYVKTAASGPVGSFANGKKCWWISDTPYLGFRPHPAFKRNTNKDGNGKYIISPFAYLSTFMAHSETVGGKETLGSKRGMDIKTNLVKTQMKEAINNRNNAAAGETGYRMFDIYDLSLVKFLALIAKANADTQAQWGDSGKTSNYPSKSGATQARIVFKGTHTAIQVSIEDMWGVMWEVIDLIQDAAGVVTLISPMDLTTTLSFGSAAKSRYTEATDHGYIRDVLDCPFALGDDTHDLMELFLVKIITTVETQASFCDHYVYYPNRTLDQYSFGIGASGGRAYVSSNGLFAYEPHNHAAAGNSTAVGTRIAKN